MSLYGPKLETTIIASGVPYFATTNFRGKAGNCKRYRSTRNLCIKCASGDASGREDFWREDGKVSSKQPVSRKGGKLPDFEDPWRENSEQKSAALIKDDREPRISDTPMDYPDSELVSARRDVRETADTASQSRPSDATAWSPDSGRQATRDKNVQDDIGRLGQYANQQRATSAAQLGSVDYIKMDNRGSLAGQDGMSTDGFIGGFQDETAVARRPNTIEEMPLYGSFVERAPAGLDSNLEGIQSRTVRGTVGTSSKKSSTNSSTSGYASSSAARATTRQQSQQRANPSNASGRPDRVSMPLNPNSRALQRQMSARRLSDTKQEGERTGEGRRPDAAAASQNTLGEFVNSLMRGGPASASDSSSHERIDSTKAGVRNGVRSPSNGSRTAVWSPFAGSSRSAIAGVFLLGIGAGVCVDTVLNIEPANVASREVIDRQTPNPNICLANGMSAMVLDQRLFISFNPFNVYVSQAEVKPGCVLRQSNWQVLESRGLITTDEARNCKRNMNTFGFVGDLRQAPEVSCVYHSEDAENLFLEDPAKATLGDGFQPRDFTKR